MKTDLNNGDKIMLIELPESAASWNLYAKCTDGGESFATVRLSFYDKNNKHISQEFLDDFYSEDQLKIIGTLESGIFTGSGLLRDEQRVALLSADPDKKYVILLETKK